LLVFMCKSMKNALWCLEFRAFRRADWSMQAFSCETKPCRRQAQIVFDFASILSFMHNTLEKVLPTMKYLTWYSSVDIFVWLLLVFFFLDLFSRSSQVQHHCL